MPVSAPRFPRWRFTYAAVINTPTIIIIATVLYNICHFNGNWQSVTIHLRCYIYRRKTVNFFYSPSTFIINKQNMKVPKIRQWIFFMICTRKIKFSLPQVLIVCWIVFAIVIINIYAIAKWFCIQYVSNSSK